MVKNELPLRLIKLSVFFLVFLSIFLFYQNHLKASAQEQGIIFTASINPTVGVFKSLNGTQGGPLPVNIKDDVQYDGERGLTSQFKDVGINMSRLGQDYGYEDGWTGNPDYPRDYKLTMGDIFPISAHPTDEQINDKNNYHFEDLDYFISGINATGSTPLFEAQYDIGRNYTDPRLDSNMFVTNGNQGGRSPRDTDKWAKVVINTIKHLNGKDGWGRDNPLLKVKYVEFPNEPCGLGGYTCEATQEAKIPTTDFIDDLAGMNKLAEDFAVFAQKIQEYNDLYEPDIKAVGVGNPSGTAIQSQQKLLEELKEKNIRPETVVFSYHDYNYSQAFLQNVKVIKNNLDRFDNGRYKDVPIINSEWNWPLYKPPPDFGVEMTEELFSAWVGSQNAQVKMLMQDYWDYGIVYRADHSMARKNRSIPGNSPYFYLSGDEGLGNQPIGTPKPAYYQWLVFNNIANLDQGKPTYRLNMGNQSGTPIAMAARTASTDKLGAVVAHFCPTINDGPECIDNSPYIVKFTGLVAGTRYIADKYVVDKNTTAFTPQRQPTDFIANNNGEILISGNMDLWSIDYWKLQQDNGEITPSARPTLPCTSSDGDANNDQIVNSADYSIWRCEFLGTCIEGNGFKSDFNCDNTSNLVDFEIWRRNSSSILPTVTTGPSPTQPPVGINPEYGANIPLASQNTNQQQIKDLGIKTTTYWLYVPTFTTQYGGTDKRITEQNEIANAQSFIDNYSAIRGNAEVMLHLMPVADGQTQTKPYSTETEKQFWQDQIKDLVTAFKGRVKRYSVGNEITMTGKWNGTMDDYGAFLHDTYDAIKAADSSATVYESGSGEVVAQQYQSQIYPYKYGTWCADYEKLQIHYYEGWEGLAPYLDSVLSTMANYTCTKPIELWEVGYKAENQVSCLNNPNYNELDHAKTIPKLFTVALSRNVNLINYVTYHDKTGVACGIVTQNDIPKLPSTSFKVARNKLNDYNKITTVSEGVNNRWIYSVKKNNNSDIFIMWSKTNENYDLSANITNPMVTSYDGTVTYPPANTIPIGDGPVFVEEK